MASKQQKSAVAETERLFQSILRYCEARREFWDSLGKAEQRSFFPPIFEAVRTLSERLPKQEPNGFAMMDVAQGRELVNRGVEIVRSQVEWLEMQYPGGIECTVAGILPPSFSKGGEVASPDFRFFLSPLRMALGLMGSNVGDTPKESWWLEDCEPEIENPIPAVVQRIQRDLKAIDQAGRQLDANRTQSEKPRASKNDIKKLEFYEKARNKSPHVTHGEVAIEWNRQFKTEEQTEQGMRQAVNRGKKFKDWQRDNS